MQGGGDRKWSPVACFHHPMIDEHGKDWIKTTIGIIQWSGSASQYGFTIGFDSRLFIGSYLLANLF